MRHKGPQPNKGTISPQGTLVAPPKTGLSSNRRVVVLAVPPVRELDLAGIVEVFVSANSLLPEDRRYVIELVTTASTPHVMGMHGLQFVCGRHYTTVEGEIHTLLIPGGSGVKTFNPPPELLSWIQHCERHSRRVGSVCTGSFLLGHAGLLDGRQATTHWEYARQMADLFPAVHVNPDPIWIRDGKIYSSAGVTSGIDLCLAMVEEDHGRKVALDVARMLVVFLCRPGSQAQFSVALQEQNAESPILRDLQVWMIDNLRADLSVPALAARVAMSERNFQRVFTREIGKSPARFVEEIRIEAVRRKLERTRQSVKEIAASCGFRSADVMGRSFQRLLKTTPAEYRARFRTTSTSNDHRNSMRRDKPMLLVGDQMAPHAKGLPE
ncbi:MAG TPA: GlxA family transcriptional regulator [Terrimicrobium sp.]